MEKPSFSTEALNNQKLFYDSRFQEGYMQDFSGLYESCRVIAIKDILHNLKSTGLQPETILDYGCGEGRYLNVLKEFFPTAAISGSDISDKALQIAKGMQPDAQYMPMSDETVNLADNSFDFITSIEVLEHVKDVAKSISEIGRLLKPNGTALISTPCANKYSIEWVFNRFTNGLQPSADGYGRFATDEPGHLRRLNDNHLKSLCAEAGINITKIYHRAHLFESISPKGRIFKRMPSVAIGFSMLDWHLFKHLPNGATMVAIGRKR